MCIRDRAYKVSGSDTSMKFEAIDTIKYNGYLYVGTGTADPSNDKVTVSTKDYTVEDVYKRQAKYPYQPTCPVRC